MHPTSNKEASNIDSSSRVTEDQINHPEKYGLEIVKQIEINDMYGPRKIWYMRHIKKINDTITV